MSSATACPGNSPTPLRCHLLPMANQLRWLPFLQIFLSPAPQYPCCNLSLLILTPSLLEKKQKSLFVFPICSSISDFGIFIIHALRSSLWRSSLDLSGVNSSTAFFFTISCLLSHLHFFLSLSLSTLPSSTGMEPQLKSQRACQCDSVLHVPLAS